ncbi:BnaAnng41090D [Brassica napus]|uniref:(rape) hypothetical protein n=1 Tax=Brassica napus TaxID=3708 RepID=A0A078K3F6_BRANA|nr:unnamed protein product [Brassica napus]CDY72422.1 BnaAnng41090D [Brassica napus]
MEESRAMLKSLILLMMISSFCLELTVAETYCHAQRRLLIDACKILIFRQAPPAECCRRIRTTPAWCVCPSVTPQRAALIDVNYAVGVIRQCGRYVARGTKCGSKCIYLLYIN